MAKMMTEQDKINFMNRTIGSFAFAKVEGAEDNHYYALGILQLTVDNWTTNLDRTWQALEEAWIAFPLFQYVNGRAIGKPSRERFRKIAKTYFRDFI